MDSCLNPSEMERLAKGELRGGARGRAESHLDRCASCRSRLDAHRPATTVTAGPGRAAAALPPREARPPAGDDEGIEGFRLLEEIHRGGQGVVWRALDERRGEIVALKILREGPFATADQRLRFDREIELARGLDHPLIVAPLLTGVSRGRPYHVMRFIEGLTLDAWARETQPSLQRILEVFRDACDAVAHAHSRGIVHRDLKPSNVLVDARGKPHVVDFGVAKSSLPGDALPLTVTGEFVGTLSHASPEQAQGDPRLVDERTDVYALGVILYELLTGRMPYPVTGAPADVLRHVIETEPKNPSSIDPAIDEQLSAIVLKALAKEPSRRYASVAALRDDVAAFLAGLPVRARPAGAWDLLSRTARRNKRWFVVAAAFAVVLGAVALLASVQAARFQRQRDRAEAAEAEARGHARELQEANALARRESHAANVAAAGLALQVGRLAEARRRLALAPEELRGWEWAHLSLAADASEAHLDGDGRPALAVGRLPDGRAWKASPQGLSLLDPRTLEVVAQRPIPLVPEADEAARAEILTVAQDASLAALRWDDASWARLGAPGRSILVADFQGRIQAILQGAAWRPDRAAFSADGRRLAATTSESYDASPRAWNTLTGESVRFASRAGGGPEGASPVAYSPDGALLAEAGGDGRVRAWDAATAEPAWEAEAHAGRATAIAWSADGAFVASTGTDGRVVLLQRDGGPVAVLETGGRPRLTAVALDHAGARAAAGDDDGNVVAWDVAERRQVLRVRGHEAAVTALGFAGADDTLLSGAADGSLQRWRADAGAGPAPLLALPSAASLAFSPDGNLLAAGAASGALRVFDVAGGHARIEAADADGGIAAIAFTADGTQLVTAARAADPDDPLPRPVRLRELAAPDAPRTLGSLPGSTALASGPGLVAALGAPGVLQAWAPGGAQLALAETFPAPALLGSVAAAPDGALSIDIAWHDGTAQRWTNGGEPWSQLDATCPEPVAETGATSPVALLQGAAPAVAVGSAREIVTCTGVHGGLIRRAPLAATALAWSPDGTRLFAGDARGVLSVLSSDPLEILLALDVHDGPVRAVAVSADGRLVATAGPDGVRLLRSR